MSSPVMIDDSMFAAVSCDVSPDPKAYSSIGSREPKQVFSDTAPLAKIREELKSAETDSPEVAVEREGGSDQAPGYEPRPEGQAMGSEHPELPEESASVDVGGEQATVLTMTPTAEECVVQGAPVAVMPAETGHGDPRSEAPVLEQPVVACSQGTAEMTVGGQSVVNESQGLVSKDVTVDAGGVVQPGAMVSPVEDAVGAEKSALIERSQGDETPQGKADTVVSATMQGDPGKASTGAESGVVRDPIAESAVGVDGSFKAEEAVSGTTEVVAKTPTQAMEPTLSGDAQAANPENDTLPTPVPEKAQGDLSNPHSVGEKVSSQAGMNAQTQGEMQEAATDGQSKGGHYFETKEGTKSQAEVLDLSQDAAFASVGRLAARSASPSGMAGEAATVKNPVQDVGEQILGSVQASLARGDRQLLVRLDPPELGSVVVRFQEQGDRVSGVLEVSRDETRREIEQALPQVLRSLQEAGVQIKRLEVADQAARDLGKEQMQQDAWAQREGSNQQGEYPEHPFQSGWSALRESQQSPFEHGDTTESQIGVGQGRIDMLI